MSRWRVLVADDDMIVRRTLEASLVADGFDVSAAVDGVSAIQKAEQRWPDAAILDLVLPDISGFEVAERLRQGIAIPIVILTSISDERTTIEGLERYADDFVVKPFSYGVLLARLNRLLAQYYEGGLHPGERTVVDERLTVDFGQRIAYVDARPVSLTPIEARILFLLMQNANSVVATSTLLRKAWGNGVEGDPESLWVRIRQLRSKLEPAPDAPRRIVTERGVGYRFQR